MDLPPVYYSLAFPRTPSPSRCRMLSVLYCVAPPPPQAAAHPAPAVRRKGARGDVAAIGAVLLPLAYGCLYASTLGGLTCFSS